MGELTTEKMNDGFWITNGRSVGFHSEVTSCERPDKEGVVYHWNVNEQTGAIVCTDVSVYENGDVIAFSLYPESKWYE